MSRPIDPGTRFGKLTILYEDGRKHGGRVYRCRCDCGAECRARSGDLKSGHKASCGCLKGATKHGHFRGYKPSPTRVTWARMLDRCQNPKAHNWSYYGGRGITVCDRWQGEHGFENFLADMGERPEGKPLTASTRTETTNPTTAAGRRTRNRRREAGKDARRILRRLRDTLSPQAPPGPTPHLPQMRSSGL